MNCWRWANSALWVGLAILIGTVAINTPLQAGDALAILEQHCVQCHGGEKTKGGLDLASRPSLMRGGESGAAILPGNPSDSLLIQTIRHQKDPHMPHKKPKLDEPAIGALVEWVRQGAQYPRELDRKTGATAADAALEQAGAITDADRSHWAFVPIADPQPPKVTSVKSVINPIDQFILARLEAAGLTLGAPADKAALIRRVTFDLIGLPPTPAQIDAFVADSSPDAYEKLLDHLLASPHYGERWGRHWLDLARYAETDGFEFDAPRPNSWRYRDYVIRSFNADKPYDRFIREQVAGDELWPDDPDALIATAFNLLGPDMVDSSDQVQRRHNTLNDMTDTTALVFLGQTFGCARCHDHKFEPISQKDYYQLQAFFSPTAFRRDHPIPTPEEKARYDAAVQKYNEDPRVKELAELEAPARASLLEKKLLKLSPEAREAHRTAPEKRDAQQANLVLETEAMVAISEKELSGAISGKAGDRRGELQDQIKSIRPPTLPRTMALVRGSGVNGKTFVLRRGEYSQPEDPVDPGFPGVLSAASIPAATDHRAVLADWIANPKNPLTARVMVNRIWQHHLGRGLVATASDLGTHGQRPTHPELLDWLASRFISGGWSVKQMHKLILSSATYRQSSVASTAALAADPDNKLYSRMNRLRLEGEAIRDSLLAISGQLNLKMGGPSIYPEMPADVLKGARGWKTSDHAADRNRRSVYIFAQRNLRFPFLEVFDAPDSNLSCPVRERSTTAPQSLTLLNAVEVTSAAAAAAKILEKQALTDDQRVTLACRLILGKNPEPAQLSMAREFLKQSPLQEFCRALFNLNDFLYLD